MKAIQPYNGGHEGWWLLHELSREHRHRVLHTIAVAARHRHHQLSVDGVPITDYEILQDGSLKHDDVVVRWTLDAFPRDVQGNLKTNIAVTVGVDLPLCAKRDCTGVMNIIGQAVVAVMEEPEPIFRLPDVSALGT